MKIHERSRCIYTKLYEQSEPNFSKLNERSELISISTKIDDQSEWICTKMAKNMVNRFDDLTNF